MTVINLFSQALIQDPTEGIGMQAKMNLASSIISTLFGFIMLPMICFFGNTDVINARGITILVILYNLINFAALYPMFVCMGKVDLEPKGVQSKVGVFDVLKVIFTTSMSLQSSGAAPSPTQQACHGGACSPTCSFTTTRAQLCCLLTTAFPGQSPWFRL